MKNEAKIQELRSLLVSSQSQTNEGRQAAEQQMTELRKNNQVSSFGLLT